MAEISFYWRYGLGLTIIGLVGMIISVVAIISESDDPLLFAIAFLMSSILLSIGAVLLREHSRLKVKIKNK